MVNRLKFLTVSFCFLLFAPSAWSQGVSVSYLFPTDGYLSAPVSPFSVRGLRLPFTGFFGLQGGVTMYNFPGLPLDGQAFTYEKPLRGSTFGLIVPAEVYIGSQLNNAQVILSGGVFGLIFFNDRLLQGNWDRGFAAFRQWEVANGSISLDNQMGWGWTGGAEIEIPISRTLALTLGAQYLTGAAPSPVSGEVSGGSVASGITTETIDYPDAETRVQGIELSVGVSF
jgi:hypothetical protein